MKIGECGQKWMNYTMLCRRREHTGGIQGRISQQRLQKASEQFAAFWQAIHNILPPVETRNVRLCLRSMVTMVLPSKISTFNLVFFYLYTRVAHRGASGTVDKPQHRHIRMLGDVSVTTTSLL